MYQYSVRGLIKKSPLEKKTSEKCNQSAKEKASKQHKSVQKNTQRRDNTGKGEDGQGLNVRGSLPRTQTVSKMSGVRIYGSRPGSSRIPRLGGEANDPAFGTCVYWWHLHTFPTNIHCSPTHSEGPTAPAWTHGRKPMQGHQTKARRGRDRREKQQQKQKLKNKKLLNVQVDRIDELNPVVEQPVNGLISIDKEMIEIVIFRFNHSFHFSAIMILKGNAIK